MNSSSSTANYHSLENSVETYILPILCSAMSMSEIRQIILSLPKYQNSKYMFHLLQDKF